MFGRLFIFILLACGAAGLYLHLRERALPQLERGPEHRVVGAFHVRSAAPERGVHALESLAKEARAHGLSFIVVTDPDTQLAAPMVIDDVVVLSYAELGTAYGQLVQLGAGYVLPAADRQTRNVLGAVRSLGGFPIVSHPTDVKRPWTGDLRGAGGLEIASTAASGRRYAGPFAVGLIPLLVVSPLRPDLALAQLYERDREALARWDADESPGFVGLCGVDTLDRVAPRLALTTWHVVLDVLLPEDRAERAAAILTALINGRFYCAAGLFGSPLYFEWGARRANRWIGRAGDRVGAEDAGELLVLGPGGSHGTPRIVLLRNGHEVARVRGRELRYPDPQPGTYRAEVRVPVPGLVHGERLLPVIYSNKLRVVEPALPPAP